MAEQSLGTDFLPLSYMHRIVHERIIASSNGKPDFFFKYCWNCHFGFMHSSVKAAVGGSNDTRKGSDHGEQNYSNCRENQYYLHVASFLETYFIVV